MHELKLGVACAVLLALIPGDRVFAQDMPYECDDNYQSCGTPQQSGGGGGGGGGSILINNTDLATRTSMQTITMMTG